MTLSNEGGEFHVTINRDVRVDYKGSFLTLPLDSFAATMPKSLHQIRVEKLMLGFGQSVPITIMIPDVNTRRLRARLILEEAIETVNALGFGIQVGDMGVAFEDVVLNENYECNLIKVIDGCCDIRVVTTGTLSAFGVADEVMQTIVDNNNLTKLGVSVKDEYGKFIKPKNFIGPEADIAAYIKGFDSAGNAG